MNGNASSASDTDKVDPQVEIGAFSNFRISDTSVQKLKGIVFVFPSSKTFFIVLIFSTNKFNMTISILLVYIQRDIPLKLNWISRVNLW